jgi:hypothetical protein
MMFLLWLVTLPFRIALGFTGLSLKTGYRTGRMLGYGRLFWLGVGVGIGLLLAPGPGRDLREKLKARIDEYSGGGAGGGGGDTELADRVRFELTHSPRTWHLQQPRVEVAAGRVTLRGEVEDEAGRSALQQAAEAVPGVQGVDNLITVAAGAGAK